jgi:hypothetical protein
VSEPGSPSAAKERAARKWYGVSAVHASVYEDGTGNQIVGSRGEWMLITASAVCGPFRLISEAKRYAEENDV